MMDAQPQASNPATALSEAHTRAATVVSCGHSGPQHVDQHVEEDVQSYGANSPRAARSQISTAVSFEGAKPAGSAAGADCSVGEDSAHSVADPEDENSSMPAAQAVYRRPFTAQPTTSVLSTAVRAGSPPARQPGSPDLYRANSVVSHTEANQRAARAGTPASVYAQGRVLLTPTTRPSSPEASRAGEQNSGSVEPENSARSSRRIYGGPPGARSGRSVHSRSQPVIGSRSRRQPDTASRQASFLAPGGKADHTTRHIRQHTPPAELNSIEAVQQGGSQDGLGAVLTSAPSHSDRKQSMKNAAESLLLQRIGSSLSKRDQPGIGGNDREHIDRALLSMQSAAKDLKSLSSPKEATPLLQNQHSAVLGSGVLANSQPLARISHQKHDGPIPPSTTLPDCPASAIGRSTAPQNPRVESRDDGGAQKAGENAVLPNLTQQVPFIAEVPRMQTQQLSADEAVSGPRPQPAVRQELDEPAGVPSDVEMTGPSHTRTPPSSPGPLEASASRLAAPSLPAGPAPAVSGGGSQQAHDTSENMHGASAQAQVVGGAPWGETAAAPAVDSGWNPPQDAEHDLLSEGAAHQANSVLGTLVNEDAVSVGNDDVKSFQPSQQQGAAELNGQLAEQEHAEPSQHGSVFPTHSAQGGPAMAVASDAAVVGLQPSTIAQLHQFPEMAAFDRPAACSTEMQEAELGGLATIQGRGRSMDSINAGRLMGHAEGSSHLPNLAAAPTMGKGKVATPHLHQPEESPSPRPPRHPSFGAGLRQVPCHSTRLTQESSPPQHGGLIRRNQPLPTDSHASTPPTQPQASGDGAMSGTHSGSAPAAATVRSGSEAAPGGHDSVVQSQPPPAGLLHPRGPQPALTIVMQGGLVGPSTEPDDGAAGPVGSKAHTAASNGFKGEQRTSDQKATSASTPPSRAYSGRSRREAQKRKRPGASPSSASDL